MTELLYKDHRLDGETTIRQVQLVSLHLLEVLKKVCEEQKMRYWLAFGTLLGVMRDGKIIPWDDDVDVIMRYEDVRKIAKLAPEIFPKDVIWQDPWYFPRLASQCFGRLRDAYSTMLEDCGPTPRRTTDPLGIPLDIFMLRSFRGKWGLAILQKLRGPLEWRYRLSREAGPVTVLALVRVWLRWLIYAPVNLAFHLRRLWPIGKKYYVEEHALTGAVKFIIPAEWFDPPRDHEFEGGSYSIPKEAEKFNEMVFGKDWMTPRKTKGDQSGIIYLPTTPCLNKRAMKYPEGVCL